MRAALQSLSSLLLDLLLHFTCSNTEIVKIPSGTFPGYLQEVLEGLLMVVQVSLWAGFQKKISSTKSAASQRFCGADLWIAAMVPLWKLKNPRTGRAGFWMNLKQLL